MGPPCYGRQALTCWRAVDRAQGCCVAGSNNLPNWKKHNSGDSVFAVWCDCGTRYNRQGYRIKPHGQLVSVSSTHYCASTPDLSTSWSRTALQGGQAPGRSYLQTSFPLRCLQRLSLPYIATRQCHWHDNRYTSGTSIPVLSY